MGCCCKRHKERQHVVTLTFSREQLVYDLGQLGYVEGDIMDDDAPHDGRHQVQDIVQSGNVDRVTRVLALAHAEIDNRLYPYTKRRVTDGSVLDDVLSDEELYSIRMTVNDNFSQTTAEYLELLVHEYMVCMVMQDWLSITKPSAAEAWALKAEGVLEKMQGALSRTMRRTRLRLHPF